MGCTIFAAYGRYANSLLKLNDGKEKKH